MAIKTYNSGQRHPDIVGLILLMNIMDGIVSIMWPVHIRLFMVADLKAEFEVL